MTLVKAQRALPTYFGAMLLNIHMGFDVLAGVCALTMTYALYSWRLGRSVDDTVGRVGSGYFVALVLGATIGGFGLGTANLWLSGIDSVGRSILGALAGAILAVEAYKHLMHLMGSTGLIFVGAFSTSVAVGRLGCFAAGLEDHTFGTATTLPWGHDFGDGTLRHPVQLYEALAMAAFLIWFLFALGRRSPIVMLNGFYLMVAFYASQRFAWEFLKPYAPVAGPLNMFHLVCLGLLAYATFMILRRSHA